MRTTRSLCIFLLWAACVGPALATGTNIYRISDLVGDTIDSAERDTFHLFPGIVQFRRAVVYQHDDSSVVAEVTSGDSAGPAVTLFRLQPPQVIRLRFIIDNHEYIARQLEIDPYAAQSLEAFWRSLRPDEVQEPAPGKWVQSTENRAQLTLHGLAAGSAAGGCIGSEVAITMVEAGHYEDCFGFATYVPPVYHIDEAVFLTTACGMTALGAGLGYKLGERMDRDAPLRLPDSLEKTKWRTGCASGALVPGLLLGGLTAFAVGSTMYGKVDFWSSFDTDPSGLIAVPAILTGACVTAEIVNIGYLIGRGIDRREAERAARRLSEKP
jgi:hypothetical protein